MTELIDILRGILGFQFLRCGVWIIPARHRQHIETGMIGFAVDAAKELRKVTAR